MKKLFIAIVIMMMSILPSFGEELKGTPIPTLPAEAFEQVEQIEKSKCTFYIIPFITPISVKYLDEDGKPYYKVFNTFSIHIIY